ncbi:hypothetical protein EG329_009662 [Mollisiaceae sp. DMI_Dod_QoI]|nr:hypothetical protein EG329_009662 [Helotiales sp. DMI_Dod_QoI]
MAHYVKRFVEQESIPKDRIILGGLGQGCALALAALLTLPRTCKFGGFIGFGGWLPYLGRLETYDNYPHVRKRWVKTRTKFPEEIFGTKILLAHSKDDPVVPFENYNVMKEILSKVDKFGFPITGH